MPKCPKCNVEINHLVLFSRIEQRGCFELDPSGDVQVIEECVVPDYEDEDFECPKCSTVLFHDRDEAESFLRGESQSDRIEKLAKEISHANEVVPEMQGTEGKGQ